MVRKLLFFFVLSALTAALPARASTLTVCDGGDTSDHVPIYGYYLDDFLKCEFIIPADSLTEMTGKSITQITWYLDVTASSDWGDASFKIFMKEVDASTFSPVDYEYSFYGYNDATVVYEGALDGQQSVMSIPLQQSFDYHGGNLLIGVYNMVEGQWSKTTFYGVATDDSSDDTPSVSGYRDESAGGLDEVPANSRYFLPKTTFEYVSQGEILSPIDLTVRDITTSTATLSWTPRDSETQWEVAYKLSSAEEWTELTVGVDSVDLSGLTSCAFYDCRVRAIKDGNVSAWSEATFCTQCCEDADKGELAYTLTDSFGDGWNGAYIGVVNLSINREEATITNANSAKITGSVRICYDVPYAFIWHKGSYDYECSFSFSNPIINEELFSISGAQNLATGDTLFVYTLVAETYPRPEDLQVGAVTYNSATLTWTPGDDETAWQVAYSTDENFDPKVSIEGATIVNVNTTPEVTLNLNEYTTYFAAVRSKYGDMTSAWCNNIVSFRTPAQFAPVEDLSVDTVKSNMAIAEWTPIADAGYSLRYREFSGNISEDFEGGKMPVGWTVIDADGDGFNWSIYQPNGETDSNGNPYSYGNFTICSASFINDVGVLSPDNWLIMPRTMLGGTLSYYVRALDPSYPDDLMEVYVSTSGSEVSDFEAVPNTMVTPIDQSLTLHTVDLSAYSGEGYVAFRHYNSVDQYIILLDNVTLTVPEGIPVQEWTVIDPTTSPTEMTGLHENTLYEVEVQAHYSGGDSPWVHTTFATSPNTAVPTDLAADNVTDITADATWEGAHDAYNLRYRAAEVDYYANDFEASSGDLTMFNNDGDTESSWFRTSILNRDDNGNRYLFGKCGMACYTSPDTVPTTDKWAVTPSATLGGELSFYMRSSYIGHPENFEVYLSTSGNTVEDFLNNGVMLLSGSTEDVLTQYTCDLSDYDGQEGYIAFRYTGGYNLILLDDVAIVKEPAGAWSVEENVTSPHTLSGLNPETKYDIQVQGIYGENKTTEWSDIAQFTTDKHRVTLAEVLAGDNGIVTIDEELAVVLSTDDYIILSDGKGNWLKVVDNNTISDYPAITALHGDLRDVAKNPVLWVSAYVPVEQAGFTVAPTQVNLTAANLEDIAAIKPNEVVNVTGYYKADESALCAYSPNKEQQGMSLSLTVDHLGGVALTDGELYRMLGVITLKEAWTPAAGAPARVEKDGDNIFSNLLLDAVTADITTSVIELRDVTDKEIEAIYNLAGMRVSNPSGGIYIVKFTDGTAAKVRF